MSNRSKKCFLCRGRLRRSHCPSEGPCPALELKRLIYAARKELPVLVLVDPRAKELFSDVEATLRCLAGYSVKARNGENLQKSLRQATLVLLKNHGFSRKRVQEIYRWFKGLRELRNYIKRTPAPREAFAFPHAKGRLFPLSESEYSSWAMELWKKWGCFKFRYKIVNGVRLGNAYEESKSYHVGYGKYVPWVYYRKLGIKLLYDEQAKKFRLYLVSHVGERWRPEDPEFSLSI